MNTRDTHDRCPHCHTEVPEAPSLALRAGVVGLAWTVSMAYVLAAIMLGPAIIAVLPVLIPMGIAMVSSAHGWAFEDRVCEACGKLVEIDGEPVAAAERRDEAALAA